MTASAGSPSTGRRRATRSPSRCTSGWPRSAGRANRRLPIKVLILHRRRRQGVCRRHRHPQFRAFKTPQDALDYEARIDRVLGVLETCRVPTIAAITGACTGGGAGIAACCDLRIGTRTRNSVSRSRARSATACRCRCQPAYGADRSGARQGHDLHRAPGRGRGGARVGLLNEVVDDRGRAQKRAPTSSQGSSPATRR